LDGHDECDIDRHSADILVTIAASFTSNGATEEDSKKVM
jgi:hypothetical protein